MVTTDSPKREKERTSSSSGMVATLCSTGKDTSRSMSLAASEGATVYTTTWLVVMSGTASMGKCLSE